MPGHVRLSACTKGLGKSAACKQLALWHWKLLSHDVLSAGPHDNWAADQMHQHLERQTGKSSLDCGHCNQRTRKENSVPLDITGKASCRSGSQHKILCDQHHPRAVSEDAILSFAGLRATLLPPPHILWQPAATPQQNYSRRQRRSTVALVFPPHTL